VLRWFNRFLKGMEKDTGTLITVDSKKYFTPEQLRVFESLPTDAINTNVANSFVALPDWSSSGRQSAHISSADNQSRLTSAATNANELRDALRNKVFAGWPDENLTLEPKLAFEIKQDNLRLRAWDLTSQHDVVLRLYLLDDAKAEAAETVSLTVLDAAGATSWLAQVRALAGGRAQFSENLAGEFTGTNLPAADSAALEKLKSEVLEQHAALAFFAPRGVGLTAWSGDPKQLTRIRRRFMLLGQTVDGMRVWDIRRAIQTLHYVRADDRAKVELHADGVTSVNALYAALFESNVRKLVLTNLPKTQAGGPDYLNVLRVTDVPQVLGLLGDKVQTR
jgi:hypothetical protein